MPSDQTRNVSLTAELNLDIRAQVTSGRCGSASEVVRAALRLMQDQERTRPDARPSRAKRATEEGGDAA